MTAGRKNTDWKIVKTNVVMATVLEQLVYNYANL